MRSVSRLSHLIAVAGDSTNALINTSLSELLHVQRSRNRLSGLSEKAVIGSSGLYTQLKQGVNETLEVFAGSASAKGMRRLRLRLPKPAMLRLPR